MSSKEGVENLMVVGTKTCPLFKHFKRPQQLYLVSTARAEYVSTADEIYDTIFKSPAPAGGWTIEQVRLVLSQSGPFVGDSNKSA